MPTKRIRASRLFILSAYLLLASCGGSSGTSDVGANPTETVNNTFVAYVAQQSSGGTDNQDLASSFNTPEYRQNEAAYNAMNLLQSYAYVQSKIDASKLGGTGVRVAVLDTGYKTHSNMNSPEVSKLKCDTESCSTHDNINDPVTDYHGTEMISLITGDKDNSFGHGIAFNSTVDSYFISNNVSIENAIKHAEARNARVVNMSFHIKSVSNSYTYMKDMLNKDMLFVTSAGNGGLTSIDSSHYPRMIASDANSFQSNATKKKGMLIVVTSVDRNNQDTLATFNSTQSASYSTQSASYCAGAKGFCLATVGNQINVSSFDDDGNDVQDYSSGTSASAAMTSGAAAVMMAAYTGLDGYEVGQLLLIGSKPLDSTREQGKNPTSYAQLSDKFGWGLLDLYKSLQIVEEGVAKTNSAVSVASTELSQGSVLSVNTSNTQGDFSYEGIEYSLSLASRSSTRFEATPLMNLQMSSTNISTLGVLPFEISSNIVQDNTFADLGIEPSLEHANTLASFNIGETNMTIFDQYTSASNTLASVYHGYDPQNPVSAFNLNATGATLVKKGFKATISSSETQYTDTLQTSVTQIGISRDIGKHFSLDLNHLSEKGSWLGTAGNGLFKTTGSDSYFVSAGYFANITPKIDFNAKYTYGQTELHSPDYSYLQSGGVRTQSFNATLKYQGKQGSIYINSFSPVTITSGTVRVNGEAQSLAQNPEIFNSIGYSVSKSNITYSAEYMNEMTTNSNYFMVSGRFNII